MKLDSVLRLLIGSPVQMNLAARLLLRFLAKRLRTLGDFGGASVVGVFGDAQEDVLQRVSVQVPHSQGWWRHAWEEKNKNISKASHLMTTGAASA